MPLTSYLARPVSPGNDLVPFQGGCTSTSHCWQHTWSWDWCEYCTRVEYIDYKAKPIDCWLTVDTASYDLHDGSARCCFCLSPVERIGVIREASLLLHFWVVLLYISRLPCRGWHYSIPHMDHKSCVWVSGFVSLLGISADTTEFIWSEVLSLSWGTMVRSLWIYGAWCFYISFTNMRSPSIFMWNTWLMMFGSDWLFNHYSIILTITVILGNILNGWFELLHIQVALKNGLLCSQKSVCSDPCLSSWRNGTAAHGQDGRSRSRQRVGMTLLWKGTSCVILNPRTEFRHRYLLNTDNCYCAIASALLHCLACLTKFWLRNVIMWAFQTLKQLGLAGCLPVIIMKLALGRI